MAEKYKRILRPSLSIKVLEKIVAIILTMPRIIVHMLGFSDDPAVCKEKYVFVEKSKHRVFSMDFFKHWGRIF